VVWKAAARALPAMTLCLVTGAAVACLSRAERAIDAIVCCAWSSAVNWPSRDLLKRGDAVLRRFRTRLVVLLGDGAGDEWLRIPDPSAIGSSLCQSPCR
jgi:hypothetical protein